MRRSALAAVGVVLVSPSAFGQSFVGKTISSSLTFVASLCKVADGQCLTFEQTIDANVYFGSDGGVYDITSDERGGLLSGGNQHKLGQWLEKDGLRSRWTLAGGGAVNEVAGPGMTIRSTFRVQGDRCTITGALDTSSQGVTDRSRVRVSYCRIRAGNPLAR